jgi:hypothetical protein
MPTPAEIDERLKAAIERIRGLGVNRPPSTPPGGWLPEPVKPKPVPQHHTERWEQVDEQDNEGERGDE